MVGFTPNGEQIVSAGQGAIKLWSSEPTLPVISAKGHGLVVKGVTFTRDGQRAISAGYDGLLCWWDVATGRLLRSVGRDDSPLLGVAVSHDGQTLAAIARTGITLRDAESGRLVRKLPRFANAWWVAFSPDDQLVAAGGQSGAIKCWNTATGTEAAGFETLPNAVYLDGLAFSHDGRSLVAVYHGGGLFVWDVETGKVAQQLRQLMWAADVRVRGVARSPQPPLFAAGIGQTVEVWDIEQRRLVHTLRGHNADVYCLTYSPDGSRIVSGDKNGVVKVWNADTGEHLLSFQAHQGHALLSTFEGYIQSLAVSPDGKTIVSAGGDTLVKLWETDPPSPHLVRKRRVVADATLAVNESRKKLGYLDRVAADLQNSSLDPATAQVALEIASALDELPSQRRKHSAEAIRTGDRTTAAAELTAAILGRFEADSDVGDELGVLPPGEWWTRVNREFAAPEAWDVPLPQVIEALGPAVEAQPRAHQFVFVRGTIHARLGQWKEAAADLALAAELVPPRTDLWHEYAYRLAFLYAWVGDWDHYDTLCRKALADFAQTQNPQLADRTAKMCLFSDHIAVDVERAASLADRGAQAGGPVSLTPWLHMAKGIADYRRERHEAAATALEAACEQFGSNASPGLAGSLFYLAMARQRLGQREAAGKAYERGVDASSRLPRLDGGDVPGWNDLIVAEMARREAEALLRE
jgi:tetratricopeptide (TPR) repeat protein